MYQEGFGPTAELPGAPDMSWFSALSPDQQREFIEHAHATRDSDDWHALVRTITGGQSDF